MSFIKSKKKRKIYENHKVTNSRTHIKETKFFYGPAEIEIEFLSGNPQ